MTCGHDGCTVQIKRKGRGRPPSFCPEHQGGAAAKARQRARARGDDLRPECCRIVGPGRVCTQHQAYKDTLNRNERAGMGAPTETDAMGANDYAAAMPRATRKDRPELPPSETSHSTHGGTDVKMLWKQPMTERYAHGELAGGFIRVIGQPDLTVDWRPVPGKRARLYIARGPSWPWSGMDTRPPVIEERAA